MTKRKQLERVAVRKRRIQRVMNKLDAVIDILREEHDLLARIKARPSLKEDRP